MNAEEQLIRGIAEQLDEHGLDKLFGLIYWPMYRKIKRGHYSSEMEDLAYLHVLHLLGLECPHPWHKRRWANPDRGPLDRWGVSECRLCESLIAAEVR